MDADPTEAGEGAGDEFLSDLRPKSSAGGKMIRMLGPEGARFSLN